MTDKSITAKLLWDRFGIGVSGICAIHCLILPVLISILPLWPALSAAYEWAHPIFILVLIPIVYFASKRSHFEFSITSTLVTGLVLVILGWLLGHYWLGIWVEIGLTLLGSVILIAGHWLNYHHHRHCKNHKHKHHPVREDKDETDSEKIEEAIVK